jgi:hypothetical protein
MTTVRQLVTDGFREAGIVEVGGEPDGPEFEEGLRKLQSMYSSLFGNELGDPLVTINYGTQGLTNSYATELDTSSGIAGAYVPVNCRLVFNIGSPQVLFLDPNPRDGARLAIFDNGGNFATNNVVINGNGRSVENSNGLLTLNTNGLNREWFYRADLGSWVRVTDLVADDESPFPVEFDDMMSIMLATRINPRYGAQMDPETVDILSRSRKNFRARYKQIKEESSEFALLRLPSNPYYYSSWTVNSTNAFNRGRP